MPKAIYIFLLSFVLSITGANSSFAAFHVREKTASVVAEDEVVTKKPFNESKTAKLFTQVRHSIYPHPYVQSNGPKTGWPGIVSFICSLLAVVSLTTIILAPLFFLFAILAIIFGSIGVSPQRHTNTGLALAGLILGSVEILLVVALIALVVSALK